MADAMQGGYSKEIFRNGTFDPKFLCNFCNNVLREPVQSFCGHRFCKWCIQTNIRRKRNVPAEIKRDHMSGGQIKCTQCEQEDAEAEAPSIITPDQIFPDNAIRREMQRLQVVCDSKECSWKGSFKQYEEHYNLCEFKAQACQYCGQTVKRSDMQVHLERECRKVQVSCEDCGRNMVREMMNHHKQNECQTEKIQCPVGCGEIERRHFADHFREKKHEIWISQEMIKLDANLEEVKSQLGRTVSEGAVSNMSEKIRLLEHKIDEIRQTNVGTGIAQMSDSGVSSAGSGTANIDAKIRQVVEMNLQSVNERLDVKTGTFEGIASALHRELEKTITAVEKLERHRREMESNLEQSQNKIRSLERSLALKDMSMAELELKAQSMEAASYDGTFMWRVHDFTKKHQDAVQGRTISIYSPPFYTTRRGYKMCARLYPNGDGMGKGSHLSLFFVVMRGNYDALLKWPFSQRVTFCIVNQIGGEHVIDSFRPDPQSSSFKRPTSDMNIASGCPLFIRLEMLQNPNHGFLKDDTLFLKIAVDTSGLTDPVSNFDERIKIAA